MVEIVWEFVAREDRLEDFRRAYASDGDWARLFRRAEGYCGTTLAQDRENPRRFLVVDRWRKLEDFESFRKAWDMAYAELDKRCTELTAKETLLGRFERPD